LLVSYKPVYTITPLLLSQVEQVAALRERILAAAVQVPWIPALQKDTRIRNAHSSTAIEGNPLTLEQVRAIDEGREIPATAQRPRREVANYFAGLRFVEKNAQRKVTTDAEVLKLHRIMAGEVMDKGKAGQYRTIRVRVGSYLAPPPERVRPMMSDLLEWWNRDATAISPILSSAILHHQFETIHPFADGNGRTGRMLSLWELYRRGFDNHHIFSIDEFYWEDRPRYYAALEKVQQDEEALTSWLEYSAEGLRVTLERVWSRIQKLTAHAGKSKLVLRPKQEQLLHLLREHKALTPRGIWDAVGISKQGALDLLRPLMKAGLVRRIGTKKAGRYVLT
jgi:Fic family protein